MPGYRHCITEEAAERQRQFESALLSLMGAKPLVQVSIQEVCDLVGLSRKSFYRYFSSKEDCLHALVDHTILGMVEVPVPGEQMQSMIQRYFSYWGQHRELLDALHRNGLNSLLLERAMRCAVEEFGIQGHLRGEWGNYAQTIFVVSGLMGVLLDWHLSGCQQTPAQLAQALGGLLPVQQRGVF